MKVILRSDLDGLGKRGDIVDVADGHARNFLLPKGHALAASDGAIEQAGRMRRARDQRDTSAREAATQIASNLGADRDRNRSSPARGRLDQDDGSAHGHGVAAQRRVVPDHDRRRRRRLTTSCVGRHPRSTLDQKFLGSSADTTRPSTGLSTASRPQIRRVVHSRSTVNTQGCSPSLTQELPGRVRSPCRSMNNSKPDATTEAARHPTAAVESLPTTCKPRNRCWVRCS